MDDTSVKAFAASKGFEEYGQRQVMRKKAEYAMQMFFENTGQYAATLRKNLLR